MAQRINYSKLSAEYFDKFSTFSTALHGSSIEEGIHHLVNIRASQLNGCALCVDMHVKQATIHGERALRLHHLAIWRESPLFTPRERAALAWAEALTKLPEHGVSDELHQSVRSQFSEKELSDLTFILMSINAWNRASIAAKTPPGAFDAAFGLDKAKLS